MNWAGKISKAAIYINNRYKSMSDIKSEVGCDVIFNGGLFDMLHFKPACWLKSGGVELARDAYKYWGYGWNDKDVAIVNSADIATVQNYIACVCLARNGKPEPLIYNAELGSARDRTAWGVRSDGTHIIYVSHDGMTPEALQAYMIAQGVDSALMLDGGGSTQGITPDGLVYSERKVHNFICLWIEKATEQKPIADAPKSIPVIEPVYKWSGSFTIRKATDFIVIHHAAGDGGVDAIHAYHQSRGWLGIGYNYYIRKNGNVYRGRPENAAGAHTVGYNDKSIGVCFEGNFEEETMNAEQYQAGVALVKDLVSRFPKAFVKMHKELDSTQCPGKNFPFAKMVADSAVPTTAPTPQTDKVYRVQVGAFKSETLANVLKDDLIALGYSAIVV